MADAKAPGSGEGDSPSCCSLLQPDNVRSILAYLVVGGLLLLLAVVVLVEGAEEGQEVAGMTGGTVGIVIGFYFGRQGFEKALDRAADAQKKVEDSLETTTVAGASASQLHSALSALRNEYENLQSQHVAVLREYKSLLAQGRKE